MAFADELFMHVRHIWDAQLTHPFVRAWATARSRGAFRALGAPGLPLPQEYARLFAWAVAKADRLESMGWYAGVLHLTLNTEMGCIESTLSGSESRPRSSKRSACGRPPRLHGLPDRTAADGEMADLVAALLPCAWDTSTSPKTWPRAHLRPIGGTPTGSRNMCRRTSWQAAEWLKAEMTGWPRVPLRRSDGGSWTSRDLQSVRVALLEMCWKGEGWPIERTEKTAGGTSAGSRGAEATWFAGAVCCLTPAAFLASCPALERLDTCRPIGEANLEQKERPDDSPRSTPIVVDLTWQGGMRFAVRSGTAEFVLDGPGMPCRHRYRLWPEASPPAWASTSRRYSRRGAIPSTRFKRTSSAIGAARSPSGSPM